MSDPRFELTQMIVSNWISQAVYVAAKLELADAIAERPHTPQELAELRGAHPESLSRLLRALASVGVFAADDTGKYSMTPRAEGLRKNVPGSMWPMAIMMGEEQYTAWGQLLYSVRTGERGFDKVYGQPVFTYLEQRPEQGQIFDAAMTAIHGRETAAMLAAYDFSAFGTLADVGGGNGSTLGAVLEKHSKLRGILFDMPSVVARAKERSSGAPWASRCQFVAGDFFREVPVAADAYLVRHIVHDWNDEQAKTLLGNIRRSAAAGARLLVVESVIESGNAPSFAKMLDLTMLVVPGGKERTREEYRQLLADSGFRLEKITPTEADVSVLEAVAV